MLPFVVIIIKEGKTMPKKATNKRKAYIADYNKENYRRINLQLHKTIDAEILEYLLSQGNVTKYLKDLIKADMEKGSK